MEITSALSLILHNKHGSKHPASTNIIYTLQNRCKCAKCCNNGKTNTIYIL